MAGIQDVLQSVVSSVGTGASVKPFGMNSPTRTHVMVHVHAAATANVYVGLVDAGGTLTAADLNTGTNRIYELSPGQTFPVPAAANVDVVLLATSGTQSVTSTEVAMP